MTDAIRTPDEILSGLPSFPFESNYRDFEDIRLAHLDVGDGPPVLFMHGEPTWSFLWRHVIPSVRDAGYRCIAPDLPGFGRSDKPVDIGWYTYDRHTESVLALVDELDVRDATIVVHDWGGPIGLRVAVERPDRIARIVVLDTGLFTGHQPMNDAWMAFRAFVERTEDLPVGMLVRRACLNDPGDEVIAAYDAPFPNPTPAQQQKGLPHFRDGGTLGITRGLSGIDVKTVLADDQSVTGYTANGTAGSNTADAKQSIINGMSIFKTGNPLQWARAISAADYLRGDPIATYQVGNQGQVGALKSGQDIIDLYKGPTPQDALAAGPFGFTTQTALTNASNAAQNFADLTKDIQSHLDDIATRRARFSAIQTRDHWKRHPDINLTDDDRKYLALGKQYHLTGKAGPYTLPGITGFSFRDGGSIRVPGAGPVDSQYVGMHVSPGEEISVKTRQQQDAERRAGAGGRPVNIVVNIQANDADSFNRSKAQTLRDFADQVGQAYNGG